MWITTRNADRDTAGSREREREERESGAVFFIFLTDGHLHLLCVGGTGTLSSLGVTLTDADAAFRGADESLSLSEMALSYWYCPLFGPHTSLISSNNIVQTFNYLQITELGA